MGWKAWSSSNPFTAQDPIEWRSWGAAQLRRHSLRGKPPQNYSMIFFNSWGVGPTGFSHFVSQRWLLWLLNTNNKSISRSSLSKDTKRTKQRTLGFFAPWQIEGKGVSKIFNHNKGHLLSENFLARFPQVRSSKISSSSLSSSIKLPSSLSSLSSSQARPRIVVTLK